MPNIEIYTHVYNGIKVIVKINYDNETISLQEKKDGSIWGYEDKKWVFASRGIKYMNGWKNILEAMIDAIKYAEAKLSIHQDKKKEELTNLMIEIGKQV